MDNTTGWIAVRIITAIFVYVMIVIGYYTLFKLKEEYEE